MKPPIAKLLLLIAALANMQAGAQLDSLKGVLKSNLNDTMRCIVLNSIIEAENDINVWPVYNEQLRKFVEGKLKQEKKGTHLHSFYLKHLSGVLNNEGYYYRNKGEIELALDFYKRSLTISESLKDRKGIAESLNNIGFIYYNLGDIPRALDYFQRCLAINQQLNEPQGIGVALNNIASIYDGQGDYNKAIEFYEKSLDVHLKNKNMVEVATTFNNIGLVYLADKQYSKALKYFSKSASIQKQASDKSGYATSLNNIGLTYNKMGDNARALDAYLKSMKAQEEISDKSGMLFSMNNAGSIFAENGDWAKAEEYCKRSLTMATQLGYPENIRNSSKILQQIYAKRGQFKDAYSMQSLYYSMRDSIANESNRKISIRSQIKYAYDQKAVADSIRTLEEKKVTIAQLKQERTQRYSLYGGLALVGLFGGFMFNRFRVTSRQKKVIELKNKETEIQKSVIEEHQKEIIDSITYAKRIQAAILPPQRMVKEFLGDSFVLYLPKDIVAGDFYWIHVNDQSGEAGCSGPVLFAAADCTGHGVPGAMVSVLCNNALNRSVKEFGLTVPGQILDKAREIIVSEFEKSEEEVKDGMDISLCSLDHKSMELKWAGANNPLWIIRNDILLEKKPDKQPIGKFLNGEPFRTHTIKLLPGDMIYIFTDGFADQFGGQSGKKFMYKNLRKLLLEISGLPTDVQKQKLHEALENWKGPLDQVDDVCIIGVKIKSTRPVHVVNTVPPASQA